MHVCEQKNALINPIQKTNPNLILLRIIYPLITFILLVATTVNNSPGFHHRILTDNKINHFIHSGKISQNVN